MTSAARSIQTGLGPLTGALTPTGTVPLTGQGILNKANLGTSPVKVLGATDNARGLVRRLEILVVTSGVNVAWATAVHGDTAPTITAVGDGSATDGSLIVGGGGAVKEISVKDNLDLYLVASAASTVVQVTCVEQ